MNKYLLSTVKYFNFKTVLKSKDGEPFIFTDKKLQSACELFCENNGYELSSFHYNNDTLSIIVYDEYSKRHIKFKLYKIELLN